MGVFGMREKKNCFNYALNSYLVLISIYFQFGCKLEQRAL